MNGRPRRPKLLLLLPLVLAACGDAGARPRDPGSREVRAPESRGGLVRVDLRPGDAVALTAPSIPVHPEFRRSEIRADYDPERLCLLSRGRDRRRLGATSEVLRFRADRPGTTEVVLELVDEKGAVRKTARFVICVAER